MSNYAAKRTVTWIITRQYCIFWGLQIKIRLYERKSKSKVIPVYRKSHRRSAKKKREGYKQYDPSLICTCLLSLCLVQTIVWHVQHDSLNDSAENKNALWLEALQETKSNKLHINHSLEATGITVRHRKHCEFGWKCFGDNARYELEWLVRIKGLSRSAYPGQQKDQNCRKVF